MTVDRQVSHTRSKSLQREDSLWIVVLAGGRGRRLETFLRTVLGESRPKQFCRNIGGR